MKKNIFTIALLITSIVLFAQSGQKNFIDQNYIEITGKAETEVIPNEIFINITINENDSKKNSVEVIEQQLISKLKALNIDVDSDFLILGFNGQFSKRLLKKNEVVKSKSYQLIAHDGLTVTKVFSVLDNLNISNFFIAKVNHSEIEKILRETKLNALKVSKEKADQYAKAINQSIGKALFIKEINNYDSGAFLNNSLNISQSVSNYSQEKKTNLEFDKIKVTASVMARFELK